MPVASADKKVYNGCIVSNTWSADCFVKNCIGEVVYAGEVDISGIVATIIGFTATNASGLHANCYGITNCKELQGIIRYNNAGINCNTIVNYANAESFSESVTELSKANGWNSLWSIKTDGLYLGNNLVLSFELSD